MYVTAKPRTGDQTTFLVGDDEITTGRATYWDSVTGEQIIEDLGLQPSSTVMRFLADEESPTFVEEDEDGKETRGWTLSYAYWWDWNKGFLRLVVADGAIYILGENGKTIDRA